MDVLVSEQSSNCSKHLTCNKFLPIDLQSPDDPFSTFHPSDPLFCYQMQRIGILLRISERGIYSIVYLVDQRIEKVGMG